MANLSPRIAQAVIACAILAGLLPLFWLVLVQDQQTLALDPSIFTVLLFTLKQAFLSTIFSVGLGLLVARALVRSSFYGRTFVLQIFALPMAVPAIVAVLGLTSLFGESGLFPKLIVLYGLPGIVMAHVFFNLPMATRIFFYGLQTVQPENFRLAAQLNFGERAIFRNIEWPLFKSLLPRVAALIFLLCSASFIIILTLGGASSTTLEVAIFQSLRMDFDLSRALQLSLLQILLCMILVGSAAQLFKTGAVGTRLKQHGVRFDKQSAPSTAFDVALIAVSLAIVLPPLLSIAMQGLFHLHFNALTLQATLTSLAVGLLSATFAIGLAWPLAKSNTAQTQIAALAAFIVPPAVMATGWFLLIFRWVDNAFATFFFIIALNSLMALPFAVAALRIGFAQITNDHMKLAQQLNFSHWQIMRRLEIPLLRRPLSQAFLMATVLSLGDLTAITLLGSHGIVTLPNLLHTEMGHYRSGDAAGTAFFLLLICAALTFAAEKSNDQI